MPLIVKFGDIFRYREEEYLYLAQNGEIIYAAKILDENKSDQLIKFSEKRRNHWNVLYSFVILSTDEFKGRIAHFKDTDKNSIESYFDVIGSLNKKDLREIKQEILNKNSAVPIKLKEMIKDIDA